jgi:RHS repeat-associated protein
MSTATIYKINNMKPLYLLFFLPFLCFGQGDNYLKTTIYKVPVTGSIPNPPIAQAQQNIQFYDGLGRIIQKISRQASGSSTNIVEHIEYDATGRQTKKYLPYVSTNNTPAYESSGLSNTLNFSDAPFVDYSGQNPFNEILYEKAEDGRILSESAPGSDWGSGSEHEIRYLYQSNNTTNDKVKLFEAASSWDPTYEIYAPTISSSGTTDYGTNELYVTVTRNENWTLADGNNKTTRTYLNKLGQKVLVRRFESGLEQDTYYVYDQFGNLSYIIPPLVTNVMAQLDNLCNQYKYDRRNRLVEKKLPGKQWEFIVYDQSDRVVASGPALAPFKDDPNQGWNIIKYDVLDRLAYTGWYSGYYADALGRKQFQGQIDAAPIVSESRTSSPTTINFIPVSYTNTVFPTTGFYLLAVSYYDNYSYTGADTVPGSIEGITTLVTPQGLPTGAWTRALTSGSEFFGAKSSIYYDMKGRSIRHKRVNYLGGFTQTDSKLNFGGIPEYTITTHKRLNADTQMVQVRDEYTYTDQGRPLTHAHKIGSAAAQLIAKYEYDKLGHLVDKKIGGGDLTGNTFLQNVNFSYNIRGWLTEINRMENLQQGTDPIDLFAFKINYNNVENPSNSSIKPLYNGNISETYWRTNNDNIERSYGYSYDALHRMKTAFYHKEGIYTGAFDEAVSYDKNGNINSLERYGGLDDLSTAIEIDDLTYTYHPQKANQLMKVLDGAADPQGFYDDSPDGISDSIDDYAYDANGNMTKDDNKHISSIVYNHLNFPVEIIFNNSSTEKITYLYDASGKKLKKTALIYDSSAPGGSRIVVTDYLDSFQYENTKLKFFPHSEGYVNNSSTGSTYNFSYIFQYKDHLGNVRVNYTFKNGSLVIIEENNYYPFGMKHSPYNNGSLVFRSGEAGGAELVQAAAVTPLAPVYKYKYNGKEYQDELGLNVTAMDARQYDNATARFNTIDALSELDPDISPYSFARNSPVVLNDPSGFCPECEDYFEGFGYEPYGGQTFMSSGGAEYTFNEIAGEWDRTDLAFTLDEVVITPNGDNGRYGNEDDRAGVDQKEDFDGYQYVDGIGQLTNALTVVWGVTQLGVNQLSQVNFASAVGGVFGVGPQVAAPRLQGFTAALGAWGNRAGIAGYALSAASIGSKIASGEPVSTADAVGFGINTFFGGVAIAAEMGVTVAFAPEIAAAALIYGAAELASYTVTGQTLEQNIIGQ